MTAASPSPLVPVRGVRYGTDGIYTTERELYSQWEPFGLSPEGFRHFWIGLGLTGWELPNGDVVLNFHAFRQALWYATRFQRPGVLLMGRDTPDMSKYTDDWKTVLSEMLLSRRLWGGWTTTSDIALFEQAAKSICGTLHTLRKRQQARNERNERAMAVINPQPTDQDSLRDVPMPRLEKPGV